MPDESLLLGQLADEFTARVRAGQMPDAEEYALQHPALAARIRELFPTLMLLEGMAGAAAQGPTAEATAISAGTIFGNYRIEGELGR
ncbi:MAG TPA: hypothetical protein VGX78_18595, partial [Pirellulales bacterium]|nr:hypothetical protein [Pirellulales bacterium]